MDAVIAGFSEAARWHKTLVNEVQRRTNSKVAVDTELNRLVVYSNKLDVTVRTPGIDRAALAYKSDKEAKSIAKKIVRILRDIEDELEETITRYSLEVYPDPAMLDVIAKEVYALASYRPSPESNIKVYVDILSNGAFVYSDRVEGPGGIPMGVSGYAIALITGDPKDYVAAYMAMRRGFKVIGIYPVLTLRGKSLTLRAENLAYNIDDTFVIKVIDLIEPYQEFIENITELGDLYEYSEIGLKLRLLKNVIEEAKKLKIKNIVLSDVAGYSPTETPKIIRAENIIASKFNVHIFRPLMGFSRKEIIHRIEFLELEDAKDPIELKSKREINDSDLKVLIELALSQ